MGRRYVCAIVLATVLGIVPMVGCGGGGSSTQPLSVTTTSLPNGTVGVAYSAVLTATGGSAPYRWSQASGGDMPAGVTLAATGMFIGTPTTAGTFGPYVFTATDTANTTASSASLSITIAGSALTVTTTSLPTGAVGSPYSVTLGASGGTAPYTWTETSGGALPPGLAPLTSDGVIAGTPTSPGNYGPYVFTVTDSNNGKASTANLTITVTGTTTASCTPQGNESLLTSTSPYAFLLKGTDSRGNPIDIAGSFTPNGTGGITAATADYNGFTNGPQSLQVNLGGSSYAFGPSGQGCLNLSFSGLVAPAAITGTAAAKATSYSPANATGARKINLATAAVANVVSNVQFSFALGFNGITYSSGRIIESDNTDGTGTNAVGLIHVQSPAAFAVAQLRSNYAFGVDGWTVTGSGKLRTAMAATFTNLSGRLSNGYADVNEGGTASGEVTAGYGLLNAIDTTTGRGTGSYYLTNGGRYLTFDFALYVLNGSDLLLISTDLATGSSTTPLLSGRALATNAPNNPATLNGYYLLASQGLNAVGASAGNVAEIGTINATGAASGGTIPTANIYSNNAGTYASNAYPGSSYTVEAASGRVVFAGLTTTPPVLYLTAGSASDGGIVGFLVGNDAAASSGVLVNQTAATPNYSVASVTGNYAASTAEDVDGLNGAFLGVFAFNGTGGYTVASPVTTGPLSNVPHAGTVSINPDGSGSLDGNFPLVTNGAMVFAIPNSGDPLLYVFTSGM